MKCSFDFSLVKMWAESNKGNSKCHFKDEWLQHKDYKDSIKKVPDVEQKAYRTMYMLAILVADVGLSALYIHEKGKKTFMEIAAKNQSRIQP